MNKPVKIVLTIIAILAIGFALVKTNAYWTHGSKIVRVTGVTTKRYMAKNKAQDVYLVFTTDETYKNVDSPAYLKFNSSDIQGKLIQSGCFKIDYYGFRVPVFSMYKNITKADRLATCPEGV